MSLLQMKSIIHIVYNLCRLPIWMLKGNKISLCSRVGSNVLLHGCTIGKYNYIGRNSVFNNVVMGNFCSVAPSVQIGGMEHSWWANSTSTNISDECISDGMTIVEHDVWIAANCIIKQGVHIGIGAVVGANSFVNKDVPPFAIVVGSPAKIIKYRFGEDRQNEILESQYWKYSPDEARKILRSIS